jgi:hypothetical protein
VHGLASPQVSKTTAAGDPNPVIASSSMACSPRCGMTR